VAEDRIVVARRSVDDDGFERICVASVDEVNPAIDLVERDNLTFDVAAVGFPDVGIRGVGFKEPDVTMFGGEVIEDGHGSERFADTSLAAADEDDGLVHECP
jgi:hypothetical protein